MTTILNASTFEATGTEPTLFTATLVHDFRHTAPFTKGKVYDVIDFNDYFGTYTIIDDNGDRACVDWLRFADQGKASSDYQKEY